VLGTENTNDYDIYWPGFREFMRILASYEPQWTAEEAVRPVFKHSIAFTRALTEGSSGPEFNFESFSNIYYAVELGRGGAPYDENGVLEMSLNYAEMIAWVFRYYTKGLAYVNFEKHYRFNYAPLFFDFHAALYIYDMADELDEYREPETLNVFAYDHMLMVLPMSSKKLLPGSLAKLMEQKGMPRTGRTTVQYQGYTLPGIHIPAEAPSSIAWYYPHSFTREWLAIDDTDEYRREIVPILPEMDLDAVTTATESVEINDKVSARFKPGVPLDNLLPYELADIRRARAERDTLIREATAVVRAMTPRGRGVERGTGRGTRGAPMGVQRGGRGAEIGAIRGGRGAEIGAVRGGRGAERGRGRGETQRGRGGGAQGLSPKVSTGWRSLPSFAP
jgi:hypothetical protein